MDAKRLADRYIARDGTQPTRERPIEGSGWSSRQIDDLMKVADFLLWQPDGEIMGGVKAAEALASFERLMGFPPGLLAKKLGPGSHV